MKTIKYFKAKRETNRFNKNQRVFIRHDHPHNNELYIRFKFRGNGRYVNGIISKANSAVGEIKEIEVNDDFAKRIEYKRK